MVATTIYIFKVLAMGRRSQYMHSLFSENGAFHRDQKSCKELKNEKLSFWLLNFEKQVNLMYQK